MLLGEQELYNGVISSCSPVMGQADAINAARALIGLPPLEPALLDDMAQIAYEPDCEEQIPGTPAWQYVRDTEDTGLNIRLPKKVYSSAWFSEWIQGKMPRMEYLDMRVDIDGPSMGPADEVLVLAACLAMSVPPDDFEAHLDAYVFSRKEYQVYESKCRPWIVRYFPDGTSGDGKE